MRVIVVQDHFDLVSRETLDRYTQMVIENKNCIVIIDVKDVYLENIFGNFTLPHDKVNILAEYMKGCVNRSDRPRLEVTSSSAYETVPAGVVPLHIFDVLYQYHQALPDKGLIKDQMLNEEVVTIEYQPLNPEDNEFRLKALNGLISVGFAAHESRRKMVGMPSMLRDNSIRKFNSQRTLLRRRYMDSRREPLDELPDPTVAKEGFREVVYATIQDTKPMVVLSYPQSISNAEVLYGMIPVSTPEECRKWLTDTIQVPPHSIVSVEVDADDPEILQVVFDMTQMTAHMRTMGISHLFATAGYAIADLHERICIHPFRLVEGEVPLYVLKARGLIK